VGFFSSTSSELSSLLTTVNGPAPTGETRNWSSPISSSAVGEAIQFTLATTNDSAATAVGSANLITTVSSPSVVIGSSSASTQLGLHVQSASMFRWMLKRTASAVKSVPSLNVMPSRIVILKVRPPSAYSQLSAWCPTTRALLPSSSATSRNRPP
jgi:hypothetical protein